MMTAHVSPGEVRVLFALLDSAQDAGLLRGLPTDEKWRAAKAHFSKVDYEHEGALMWELLEELERAHSLEGSWILQRWQTIKFQVERSKSMSYHPFF